MRQAKILLLKTDETDCLASELYTILASSACLDLSLDSETIKLVHLDFNDANPSQLIKDFSPDLCFLLPPPSLPAQVSVLLQLTKTETINIPLIVVMGGEPSQIVELLRQGVVDFFAPPLRAVDILPRVWKLTAGGGRAVSSASRLKKHPELEGLIGQSPTFLAEINKIPLMAGCNASVLISGETGTGKELCARAIHYLGGRARKPFVPVNCGAIPTELIENELFGHERGAFTGAATSELGLIQAADGGTLFLDEVDCLPPQAQVKLLRFLQEKEYRPLGSTKLYTAHARIIAATNVDLQEAVRSGRLRRDMYYRLSVMPLCLPPLRERREDIPILARHFLAKYASEFGKQVTDFSEGAIRKLVCYGWPGNVRELEHVVEQTVVLSSQALIGEGDINLQDDEEGVARGTFQEAKGQLIRRFEKTYIQDLLLANGGNVSKAARAANKNRRAFWQLICKHHIDVQRFRAAAK